jgi:hypothetical protein
MWRIGSKSCYNSYFIGYCCGETESIGMGTTKVTCTCGNIYRRSSDTRELV